MIWPMELLSIIPLVYVMSGGNDGCSIPKAGLIRIAYVYERDYGCVEACIM